MVLVLTLAHEVYEAYDGGHDRMSNAYEVTYEVMLVSALVLAYEMTSGTCAMTTTMSELEAYNNNYVGYEAIIVKQEAVTVISVV
jgi:hypothetical protein